MSKGCSSRAINISYYY